jgi:hypothetical protein
MVAPAVLPAYSKPTFSCWLALNFNFHLGGVDQGKAEADMGHSLNPALRAIDNCVR